MQRVAITGLGVISCLGLSCEAVTDALRSGRSGIVSDPERARLGFRSPLTGRIEGFAPKQHGIGRKVARTMGEPARYAYAAARQALAQAQLPPGRLEDGRCGVIFGNDSTVAASVAAIDSVREHGETHFIGGGNIFQAMNSTVSMNLAVLLGLRGANWTVSAACASGAFAVGQAAGLIRAGLQDVVLAGGAQETSWQGMASFDALGAFSTCEDPARASRPFDVGRDGLVPSGGAACLVLESESSATARGAPVLAWLTGFGFSANGSHLSQPSVDGPARAMRAALADAGRSPQEIGYVNAHATSTPAGDKAEAGALAEVFGVSVPVSSTKGLTGHECWMAGASEVLYTVLMLRAGFLAPNANFTTPDPELPALDIVRETRPTDARRALSNSFGFGGTNAALVLELG